jgi:hypothetical protein
MCGRSSPGSRSGGRKRALHGHGSSDAHRGPGRRSLTSRSSSACLLAGRIVWFYAGKLLWPRDLVFIYPTGTPGRRRRLGGVPCGRGGVTAPCALLARRSRGPAGRLALLRRLALPGARLLQRLPLPLLLRRRPLPVPSEPRGHRRCGGGRAGAAAGRRSAAPRWRERAGQAARGQPRPAGRGPRAAVCAHAGARAASTGTCRPSTRTRSPRTPAAGWRTITWAFTLNGRRHRGTARPDPPGATPCA